MHEARGWLMRRPDQIKCESHTALHVTARLDTARHVTARHVPSGIVSVVWEMALDRVPPAMLTFAKPKAWLTMRMKVQKG